MSLLNRLNKARLAFISPNTQKYYNQGGFGGNFASYGGGLNYPQHDIINTQSGYASAYGAIWYIRAAVDLYAQMAQDVPSQIVKNATSDKDKNEIIATSRDVKPQHIWYQIEDENRKDFGINIIPSMIYQLMLYDMLFVEKIRNEFGYPWGARVLNTLGITINENYGNNNGVLVTSYNYSWNGDAKTFKPNEIAYEHGFNPYDGIYGSSIIESVIDQLNIDRNLNHFLRAFFINDARPSLIGSPDPALFNPASGMGFSDEQQAQLKKILNDKHRGVDNSFTALIPNIPINWETLEPPQIQQFTEMQLGLQRQVLAAFGVNPSLLGMTENTNYKEGIEIQAQFVNSRLKPVLSQVEAVINIHLLPFLTESNDYQFSFDYESYNFVTEQDVLRLDLDTKRLNSGTLSMNDFSERQGGQRVDAFEKMFMIEGLPIPENEIVNLWKYKFLIAPSVYNSELITAQPLPQPANPNEVIPTTSGGDSVSDAQDVTVADDIDDTKSHDHTHDIPDSFDEYVKLFYQPLPSKDERLGEWQAWRKFIKNGKHLKATFEPHKVRGDIADSIQNMIVPDADKSIILDAIDSAIESIKSSGKAIQSVRIEFELALEDLIEESRSRDISKNKFELRMMQTIRSSSVLAYIEGLRSGGVIGQEPNVEEMAQIETHVQSQRKFVNQLSDKIYSEKGITDAEAQQKQIQWYNGSIAPMFDGGRTSADKNAMMMWSLGKTEKHCKDCLKLDGQIHRMVTYWSRGILPASDRLECGEGKQCDCGLTRVSAKARGRLPNI